MLNTYWRSPHNWLLAGTLIIGGCSQGNETNDSNLADSAAFEPAPADADKSSVDARLSRYRGQTSFLNFLTSYGVKEGGRLESAEMNGADIGTGRREVQEADIYKIKPDSKILYLLNNYRGLQVVDFSAGASKPELKARVPATGNFPEAMYYDKERDRIVVVERYSVDDTGKYDWSSEKSRILVYAVNDEGAEITQSVEFYGSVADQRLVGDVLYVAASYRGYRDLTSTPDSSDGLTLYNPNQTDKPRGVVYSFKLGDEVSRIATHELKLPTNRENMNIVEVPVGEDLYQYYLVATISNTSWWSRDPSAVEVLDITDPKGKVKPVMVVGTKGQIAERNSTKIKNNTLIAVSSFRQNPSDWQSPTLIAVETFKFPKADKSNVVDANEVQFRKLYIQRELEKKFGDDTSSDAYLEAKVALESDAKLGINDLFEKTTDGKVVKVKADTTKTVRDSRGQSALLQDVRWYEDYLYVFWTPTDLVDPLEVFDITSPENGAPHLGHLEFEGWIERSFPIAYNGRDYIIGLGQVVPSIDNERGLRHPQAMLYEVIRKGNQTILDVKTKYVFKDHNLWTQFNSQDKMIEFNVTAPDNGEGYILFKASQYADNQYVSGGKLLGFDLSKIEDLQVFSEGSLLKSEWGWLRRVFSNPELGDIIHTFSDQQLRVFERTAEHLGEASTISEAVAALELARNIEAYQTLSADSGVQIISKGSEYWWVNLGSSEARTELRLVAADQTDAELDEVKQVVELEGQYQNHHFDGQKLVVLTKATVKNEKKEEGEDRDLQFDSKLLYRVYSVVASRGNLKVTNSGTWEAKPTYSVYGREIGLRIGWGYYQKPTLIKLENGDYLVAANSDIRLVDVGSDPVSVSKAEISQCDLTNARQADVKLLGSQPYLHYYFQVDSEGKRVPRDENSNTSVTFGNGEDGYSINYAEYFVAPLQREGNKFSCADAVNIPGEPVAVNGDHLVVNDTRLISKQLKVYKYGDQETKHWEVKTHNVLGSLSLSVANDVRMATLVDLFDPYRELGHSDWAKLHSNWVEVEPMRFVFVEQKPYQSQNYYREETDLTFSVLSFDDDKRFLKKSEVFDLGIGRHAQLNTVKATDLGYVGVVTSGRRVAAVTWSDTGISALKLRSLDSKGKWSDAKDYGVLPGYYSNGDFDVNAASRTINVPNGLFGVSSFQVVPE